MKKYLILVLTFLILVLCSCNNEIQHDNAFEIVGDNEFFIKGELPDIGEYSNGEIFSRFYESFTPNFIPSDKYGMIIPFIGKNKDYYLKDTQTNDQYSTNYSFYGFCTPDGRIVMDAGAYDNVYLTTTDDGFSYYTLTTFSEYDEIAKQIIIPLDGSFMLELSSNSYLGGVSDGIIVVCQSVLDEDGKYYNDNLFYDYSGNLLFEYVDKQANLLSYKNGYAKFIRNTYYSDNNSINSDNEPRRYFIDKKGNKVLTQFYEVTDFNENGFAGASLDGKTYGFIDTSGNFVLQPKYARINTMYGNEFVSFCGITEDGFSEVLSNDLKVIGRVNTDSYIRLLGDSQEKLVAEYYQNERDVYVRLSDGTEIYNKEYNVYPNRLYTNNNEYFFYVDYEKHFAVVMDYYGNTVDYIENVIGIDGYFSKYNILVCQYLEDVNDYNTRKTYLYSLSEKKIIKEFDNYTYHRFLGDNSNLLVVDTYFHDENQDKSYMYFYSPEHITSIYDVEKGEFVLDNLKGLHYFKIGDKFYFCTYNDSKMVLYDDEFQPIIKLNNKNLV